MRRPFLSLSRFCINPIRGARIADDRSVKFDLFVSSFRFASDGTWEASSSREEFVALVSFHSCNHARMNSRGTEIGRVCMCNELQVCDLLVRREAARWICNRRGRTVFILRLFVYPHYSEEASLEFVDIWPCKVHSSIKRERAKKQMVM